MQFLSVKLPHKTLVGPVAVVVVLHTGTETETRQLQSKLLNHMVFYFYDILYLGLHFVKIFPFKKWDVIYGKIWLLFLAVQAPV